MSVRGHRRFALIAGLAASVVGCAVAAPDLDPNAATDLRHRHDASAVDAASSDAQTASDSPTTSDARAASDAGDAALADAVAPTDVAPSTDAATLAEVTLTIDRTTPIGTSALATGLSQVDSSLRTPWTGNDPTAVTTARAWTAASTRFVNQHLMAWGQRDPWPNPTDAEPSQWSDLDNAMTIAVNTGATPMLTLCEAPWWMKGQLQADGSTRLIAQSEDWAQVAYAARVLDDHMNQWLHLVQRAAERYMAPPYNVRYFQVWNELKGYYDPITNAYDYTTSAGNPTGPNARHGYTYMYNQVYARLHQVATSLGIPVSEIRVGGPYVVMDSGATASIMSNPSQVSGPWGVLDQRPLDVISYWLANRTGAEFVTVDGSNYTKFGSPPADDFTTCDKLAAVDRWIRAQPNGGATLPIFWAEWYAEPHLLADSDAVRSALGTYALMQHARAGTTSPLLWAEQGVLWTPTTSAGGGQPAGPANTERALHDAFPPGTALYRVASTSPDVDAIASATHALVLNKRAASVTVSVGGTVATLAPYESRLF